jgi:glycosyltransferase involved in cell wall biosynthesis
VNSVTSRLETARPAGKGIEIIVPVYNEESILESQLRPVLQGLPSGFCVRVMENGSTDGTPAILDGLAGEFPSLTVVRLPEPNYGRAMKQGLESASADILVVDDLDVLDTDFWTRGLDILGGGGVDMVQGSKVLAGRDDRRPLVRRAATKVLTGLLRLLTGFRGTDTHGPKVMFRKSMEPVMKACSIELDLYPSELVIRAQRAGLRIVEIPIHLREIRATPLPLCRRVPRALRDLLKLRAALKG